MARPARTTTIPAAIVALAVAGVAGAQTFLTRVNPRHWTLHAEVVVSPIRWIDGNAFFRNTSVELQSCIFVYPLLEGSASHETHAEAVRSELYYDDHLVDDAPELFGGYQCGERIGKWDGGDGNAANLRLVLDLPMTSWETRFDDEAAAKVRWPRGEWPAVAASALKPQMFIDSDSPVIGAMIQKWLPNGPRRLRPVHLAKFLAANVLNNFREFGGGYEANEGGALSGIQVRSAALSAELGEGTAFDRVAVLCAVYRAAGLPARIVIGQDILRSPEGDEYESFDEDDCAPGAAEQGGTGRPYLTAWVEFFLYDEPTGHGEWIPVDINRQRETSSRAPDIDRPWKYFGNNRCLDFVAPISFHFHPPTTVINAGPPALWGWIPTPLPDVTQAIRFSSMETPQTTR